MNLTLETRTASANAILPATPTGSGPLPLGVMTAAANLLTGFSGLGDFSPTDFDPADFSTT